MTSEETVLSWLGRAYAVSVRPLSEADGGGFIAWLPELGEWTCSGTGASAAEAMADLRECQTEFFHELLEAGQEPPPPTVERADDRPLPSGKVSLRLPRDLHARLRRAASRNGVSLNTYVVSLLASSATAETEAQSGQNAT